MRSVFPSLVVVFLFPILSVAQALPFDTAVVKGRLDNGLTYFIKKNKKPENRAELRLVVDAGSLLEEDNQQGLAHFVEHMAFNGTKHFAKNELVDFLELTGTRFGADLNAYTSFDETVYKLQVRTDSVALLDKGLLILADWAQGVSFDSTEIEKERGVVLSEWRTRLSPNDRLQQAYFPVIYKNSRFADRLPIGKPEIIEQAPMEVIKQYYQDWYRTDLMAIVAIGDFDVKEMESKIIRQFAPLKAPTDPRERSRFSLPSYSETRTLLATDEEAPFTQVAFQIQHPGREKNTFYSFKNNFLISLYNRMLGARLYEVQQTQNPPFTFASSSYNSSLGGTDAYSITAFVNPQKVEAGFSVVYEETKRAIEFGFTSTEFDRQVKESLSAAERNYQERNDQASTRFAANLVYHYLNKTPVLSADQYLALLKQVIAEIQVEDVNKLAADFLKQENRSLIITGPRKDSSIIPQPTRLLEIIDSIDQLELTPYIDEVPINSIFDFSLPETEIAAIKSFDAFGVTEYQLENGVRVVLKPTDFKADEIMLRSISPGGHSLVPDSLYQSAIAAITLSSLSGLGDLSAPQLQKNLAGIQVGAGPYINEFYEGINGRSTKADLEKLFQLIHLYFTAPRFEEAALEGHLQRQENILENITINPYYFFGALQSNIKYQGHPRRKGIATMEDLSEISVQSAAQFYKERFADASD
ncbi:MAG: insulinase family protein, partial [Bacteroidota bacterium]